MHLGHIWRALTRGLGAAWSSGLEGRGLGLGMTRGRSYQCEGGGPGSQEPHVSHEVAGGWGRFGG